mgnify:CR=1 FL=1
MDVPSNADHLAANAVRASQGSLETAVLHHHEQFGEAPELDELWDDPTLQAEVNAVQREVPDGADLNAPLMNHLGRFVDRVTDGYHQSFPSTD